MICLVNCSFPITIDTFYARCLLTPLSVTHLFLSFLSLSKKSGKIKSAYKREHVNVGCDVDYDINGTAVHGAAVVGFEGWLAGYQMTFEAGRNRVTQSNFAVGYKTEEFQLHTNV